jgi:Na+-translocating ferredoxin:NAD+ oxidoreductase subunit B
MTREFLTAVIRAEECIGCSRCIPACPVDAIVGTNKYLHTVLLNECIGCKLCIDLCPVDCIDMVPLASLLPIGTVIDKQARGLQAKQRYKSRQVRLQQEAQRTLPVYASDAERRSKIRAEIQESLARVQAKRNE